MTAVDQVLTVGRPTVDSLVTLRDDRSGDRAGELAVEVVGLRERIVEKTASLPICGIGWMSLTGAWTRPPKTSSDRRAAGCAGGCGSGRKDRRRRGRGTAHRGRSPEQLGDVALLALGAMRPVIDKAA
jgi:hypothetical protein